MTDRPTYHEGMRRLQDARDTRRIADRLSEVTLRHAFTDEVPGDLRPRGQRTSSCSQAGGGGISAVPVEAGTA